MRVLFVLPRMFAGGVERVTLNLAAAFRHRGTVCRLALRHPHGELLAEARQTFDSVEVIAGGGMRHFMPSLVMLIKAWKPTHIVTAFADVGLLTLIAHRWSGVNARLIHGTHNTHAFANRRQGVSGLLHYGMDSMASRIPYPCVATIFSIATR